MKYYKNLNVWDFGIVLLWPISDGAVSLFADLTCTLKVLIHCRPLLRQQAIMEAVIAKLEEQGTDDEVIASYKEQMTSAQRLQLENFNKTVNKYVDVGIWK